MLRSRSVFPSSAANWRSEKKEKGRYNHKFNVFSLNVLRDVCQIMMEFFDREIRKSSKSWVDFVFTDNRTSLFPAGLSITGKSHERQLVLQFQTVTFITAIDRLSMIHLIWSLTSGISFSLYRFQPIIDRRRITKNAKNVASNFFFCLFTDQTERCTNVEQFLQFLRCLWWKNIIKIMRKSCASQKRS